MPDMNSIYDCKLFNKKLNYVKDKKNRVRAGLTCVLTPVIL